MNKKRQIKTLAPCLYPAAATATIHPAPRLSPQLRRKACKLDPKRREFISNLEEKELRNFYNPKYNTNKALAKGGV